eukprot:TRINITY_DN1871_c0_g2_i3.p1 TRINITY_DN1871_c0_g2~~TRINITY_DN1871_c0_g2_i3.p1  ORF type:complete len:894 (+),score=243.27 TRINITY_DN1871_c0_g2_i3:97-2778(+)
MDTSNHEINELCSMSGVGNPERFIELGIKKIGDLLAIDIVQEMKFLESRGISYMELRKLKNAAEELEVSQRETVVKLKAMRMEAMTPPSQFADRFASLTRGCYCWRIVEHIKSDKRSDESVLVITAEFLLICSLEGSITNVIRCQDIELAAIQNTRPALIALKAFEKCCEPTVVLSLRPHISNPVNDSMHPLHALNFVRKPRTNSDLDVIKLPPTQDVFKLPKLVGTFEEGDNYLPPHMKFQILQQTRSWPQGGASSLPAVEFVFKGEDGSTNCLRLGKSFGSTGKLQWYVDGKAKMPDIREVRYDGALKFRKGDNTIAPSLPKDLNTREQALKAIAALAAKARIRCNGMPSNKKKGKNEEKSTNQPFVFKDLIGVSHRLTASPKGGIEWWIGPTMYQVKYLSYDGSVLVGGSAGPNARVSEGDVLNRIKTLSQATGVTCVGFPGDNPPPSPSIASTPSYRHDPYQICGSDSDSEVEVVQSPGSSFSVHSPKLGNSMRDAGGAASPPSPSQISQLSDRYGVAGCLSPSTMSDAGQTDMDMPPVLQPNEDLPPYRPSFSNRMHSGLSPSPSPYMGTPTPPPPLVGTPTHPSPTPPPHGHSSNVLNCSISSLPSTGFSSPVQRSAPFPQQSQPTQPSQPQSYHQIPQQHQQPQQQQHQQNQYVQNGYHHTQQQQPQPGYAVQVQPAQPQQQQQQQQSVPMTQFQLPAPQQPPPGQYPQTLPQYDYLQQPQQKEQQLVRMAVLFKYGRRGEFVSSIRAMPGEYVVVETQAGLGIGLVAGERKGGRRDDSLRIQRKTEPHEVKVWSELLASEQNILSSLQQLVVQLGTSMIIHRVEFPMDASRLIVHYSNLADHLLPQFLSQAQNITGCKITPNNCFPATGQCGEPIDESAQGCPQL